MKVLKQAAAVILLAIALGACASDKGLLPPESLYPKILTTCQQEPTLKERTDKTKARPETEKSAYLKSLRSAYLDCSDTVEGWKNRRALYVKQYEHQHYGFFSRTWRAMTDADSED